MAQIDEKYKQLNLLIERVSTRLTSVEEENLVLQAKVRALESSLRLAESAKETAKALKEWKDAATSVLKKLYSKIDKEIEKIENRASSPNLGDK
ncbi:MAG: hypothetical protein LBM71_05925 [Elusimicrobiota bacterium]|jgi:gas vesicle protein|nr:hypothetical protein [Elusimicrobiota bacterium]